MSHPNREQLKLSLRSLLEQTIEERIDRYISVGHQWITGNHHFAHASSECLCLFRDGYFTSCIMVSQAVSDGILKFVADRNGVKQESGQSKQELARRMQQVGLVTEGLVQAFWRIQAGFRNDFHHMNPPIATVDLAALAKRNIKDLAAIEGEIFECGLGPNGTLIPKNPKYWDFQPGGLVAAYVRRL